MAGTDLPVTNSELMLSAPECQVATRTESPDQSTTDMIANRAHKRGSKIVDRQICMEWIDVTRRTPDRGFFPHQTSFNLKISIKTSNGNVFLELAERESGSSV